MEQTNVRLVDRVLDVMETLARFQTELPLPHSLPKPVFINQPYIVYLLL